MLKAYYVPMTTYDFEGPKKRIRTIDSMILRPTKPDITVQNISAYLPEMFFPVSQPTNVYSIGYIREIPLSELKVTDLSIAQLLQLIASQGGNPQ